MLLNILPCTSQPSTRGNYLAHNVIAPKWSNPTLSLCLGRPHLTPDRLFVVGAVVPGQSRLNCFKFVVNDLTIHGFVGYVEGSGFLPHSQRIGLWTSLEFHGDWIIVARISLWDVKPNSLGGSQPYPHAGLRLQRSAGETGVVMMVVMVSFPEYWQSAACPASAAWCLCFYCWVLWLWFSCVCFANDLVRYNSDEMMTDRGDNGWKTIYTDVFRFPSYCGWLCAEFGVGAQKCGALVSWPFSGQMTRIF